MGDWIAIFETEQLYLAEMVKGILEENNIKAVILNQQDSSYKIFGTITVMINQEDKGKAEEIIKSAHCE